MTTPGRKLEKDSNLILRQFAELLIGQFIRDQKRKKKLETFPDGYFMSDEKGAYTCFICQRTTDAKDMWFDKYGYKCRECYSNVQKGVISKTLSKKRDSWFTDWEVSELLNIHPSTREKLIRQHKLNVINLKDSEGKIYERIFYKKDNPDLVEVTPK